MIVTDPCTFKNGWLRRACSGLAIGRCIYCNEPFCAEHGRLGEDYAQICTRPECEAKRLDVAQHQAWVRSHYPRSKAGYCVADECTLPNEHECQRCHLRFCNAHLAAGTATEYGPAGEQRVVMMLCPHCLARRQLWD